MVVTPPNIMHHDGVFAATSTGGDGVEQLEVELESGAHQHTGSGDVSMVVRTDKPL